MLYRIVSFVPLFATLVAMFACTDLNYPDPVREDGRLSTPKSTAVVARATDPGVDPDAFEPLALTGPEETSDEALSWSQLTLMARDLRQQGELDEARERLEQAAIQLQSLVPTNAQRRTVFGLQARLAMTFAEDDQIEVADEYADELFALAEAEPELGDAALVTLAYSVAERRQTAAEAANEPASQLDLFRIALRTAQAGAPTRERMNLAYQVSAQAYREGELALAREAIEQSIADATRISPTYLKEIAGMQLFRARIALAQDDFVAAESAATRANLIFEEISAEAAQRGVGEAVLAEALAEQGQLERALAVASGAHARLELGEPIAGPARRQILASLARVERTRGDLAAARIHFEEALAIEASQNELDQMLVESIALELQTLRDSGSADVSEVD